MVTNQALFQEVLSWPVGDILKQENVPFVVETIPNEFDNHAVYAEAFSNPSLAEIWHQIHSSMNTISRGLDIDCSELSKNNRWLNGSNMKLNLENGKNMPRNGDLMLVSERGLETREQIIKAGSFCTFLVVRSVNTKIYQTSIDVCLSQSPYGGSIRDQSSYQVLRICNLTTFACCWAVMKQGCHENREIINLMLTKSTEYSLQANGEYGIFTGMDFGLNNSQKDAAAGCISASKHPNKVSVHLIWGPPGTGKTKTASVVLLTLLRLLWTQRTLVCAPTNTALIQLASRLVSLLEESTKTEHLLEDIIIFGSEKLMNNANDLSKISLDYRIRGEYPDYNVKNCPHHIMNNFLRKAKLVFCTPCSSFRFVGNQQFDNSVIDEAASLKECESLIPLTIGGIKHVALFGDDKQLQSLVMSPVAKDAKYGRSLFERLSEIGHHKQLLDEQYRMHPDISKFPNKNFYGGKIKDRTNSYGMSDIFMGHIFHHYSFIHVEGGTEKQVDQSFVNRIEAFVAEMIVARLAEVCTYNMKKTSVGIISLYKSQAFDLQERLKRFHGHEFLSVKVQTVDSCQGDEKDIIILSTVRCNHGGAIGFLDSDRRTNVALTRARKYLWILGHGPTLQRSNSVWSKVVDDAKRHICYFRANEDHLIADAIDHFKATEINLHVRQDMKPRETNSDTGQGQLCCPSPPQCSKSFIYTQLTGASLIEEEDSLVDGTIEEASIPFRVEEMSGPSPATAPPESTASKSADPAEKSASDTTNQLAPEEISHTLRKNPTGFQASYMSGRQLLAAVDEPRELKDINDLYETTNESIDQMEPVVRHSRLKSELISFTWKQLDLAQESIQQLEKEQQFSRDMCREISACKERLRKLEEENSRLSQVAANREEVDQLKEQITKLNIEVANKKNEVQLVVHDLNKLSSKTEELNKSAQQAWNALEDEKKRSEKEHKRLQSEIKKEQTTRRLTVDERSTTAKELDALRNAAQTATKYLYTDPSDAARPLAELLSGLPDAVRHHCRKIAKSASCLCLATTKSLFPHVDIDTIGNSFPAGTSYEEGMKLFNDASAAAEQVTNLLNEEFVLKSV